MSSSIYLLLLFFFCFCCCHPFLAISIQSPLNSTDDRASLLAFKSSLYSYPYDPYDPLANWNLGVPICNWTGIACDIRRERVVSLNLTEMFLEGVISPSLGSLSFLQSIDLSYNNFYGHIPPDLGNLSRLMSLSLDKNGLNGSIPSSLGRLSALTYLSMNSNYLQGPIPAELGMLKHLEELCLSYNPLLGIIPIFLSNLSSLTRLDISGNKLSSIPEVLGYLKILSSLDLSGNSLSGIVPISLSNLSSLTLLDISGNSLSSIPEELGYLRNLSSLDLSDNLLSETVPISFSNLSSLTLLDISKNNLNSIPEELRYLKKLNSLDLSGNSLSGTIPISLSNLSSLTLLDISINSLQSSIPKELGLLTHLQELRLSQNQLSGQIPDSLGCLKDLRFMNLSYNLLSGAIPISLSNLSNLTWLDISRNNLNSSIPEELGLLTNLQMLQLSQNQLSGQIPDSLGYLNKLESLDLSYNWLTGTIPISLSNLSYLTNLDISINKLNSSIPEELGLLIRLQELQLFRNQLSGQIPDSLGYLKTLYYIDLSCNSFSGRIPISLTKLRSLQYLYLSSNNLTGDFDGEHLANGGMFISLDGNNDLCGICKSCLSSLRSCPWHKSSPSLIKVLGGVIAFILCCLLLGFLWVRKLHSQGYNLPEAIRKILQNVRPPLISYEELVRATDRFNQTNLLGTSSFGSVYKGILSDGTLIAVKVLNVMKKECDKSFKAECKVLKEARHRNLIKIITTCSNLHFKGLVFEFLSNGSLEKHLYPNRHHVCKLGLKELLSIAIDISHAVEYLHYDCYVQIIHCDIKPSNVLLDQDMTARITDFGIARLVGEASLDSLTSTINLKGTVGYIAPGMVSITILSLLIFIDLHGYGEKQDKLIELIAEYGLSGRVSTQGDVYSYGILLLEMLTKKRPTDNMFEGDLSLHKWVSSVFPNRAMEVVDKSLLGEEVDKETEKYVTSLMRIGLLCSKDSPQERPTMRDVSSLLKSIREDWASSATSSSKLTPTISNLLNAATTSVTVNCEDTSDVQSSSTF